MCTNEASLWFMTLLISALLAGCADDDYVAPPILEAGAARYLTADFPGGLQARLKASRGGEVLFFNGAVGNQVRYPGTHWHWSKSP